MATPSVLCRVGCTNIFRSPFNIAAFLVLDGTEPCVQPAPTSSCQRPIYVIQRDVRLGDAVTLSTDSMKGTTMTLRPGESLVPNQVTFTNTTLTSVQILTANGYVTVAPATSLNLTATDFPSIDTIIETVKPVCSSCTLDNKEFNLWSKPPLNPTTCGLVDRPNYIGFVGVLPNWLLHFDINQFIAQACAGRWFKVKQDCSQAILKVFTYGIDLQVGLKQKRWILESQIVALIGLRPCDTITFTLSESTQQLEPTVTGSAVCPQPQVITLYSPAQATVVTKPNAPLSDSVITWNNDADTVTTRIVIPVTSQAVIH